MPQLILPRFVTRFHRLLALCCHLVLASSPWSLDASADSFVLSASRDRWMYPFAATPGQRPTASLFGADDPMFDDRDGQMIAGFDTGAALPAGLPPESYSIGSVRLVVRVASGGFAYDPTYDAASSYFCTQCVDADLGRPIELFGVGYRNGFGTLSFLETSPFGSPGGPAPGVRNAYPTDFLDGVDRDVSNNIDGGFDVAPFAIATVSGLAAGQAVPAGSDLVFDLATSPAVSAYLQNRLALGFLDLALTTVAPASFGGPSTHPILLPIPLPQLVTGAVTVR